jgi:DNA-binding transcriptional LysR family regulator
MQLRMLRAFVEVVRQGGFSQAAKAIFATQSTVSKSVQSLEAELGAVLFDRVGHKSSLTVAGEIVYRRAQRILAERDDLLAELDEVRGLKRGLLRLGLPPLGSDTLFAPLFATFRGRYPGIDIRLVEHGSRRLEEMLLAGELDLAGLLAPVGPEFDVQQVRREPLMALMTTSHPLASGDKIGIQALAAHPFILFEEGFALNPIILAACTRRGVTPTIIARSGQIHFIVELAAAGLGIAFLPRMIAEQYPHPRIARILLDEPDTEWRMVLAWRHGAYLAESARAWLALTEAVDTATLLREPRALQSTASSA